MKLVKIELSIEPIVVRNKFQIQVRTQVWGQIWDQVWDQSVDQVVDKIYEIS